MSTAAACVIIVAVAYQLYNVVIAIRNYRRARAAERDVTEAAQYLVESTKRWTAQTEETTRLLGESLRRLQGGQENGREKTESS